MGLIVPALDVDGQEILVNDLIYNVHTGERARVVGVYWMSRLPRIELRVIGMETIVQGTTATGNWQVLGPILEEYAK